MLAPSPQFVLRPLLTGEPFGFGSAMRLDLDEIAREQKADFHRAAVTAVDPGARSVHTDSGESVEYDALLLAIGTRSIESVPGAINFGVGTASADFADVLAKAEAGRVDRILFVAPPSTKWSLAIYELALLTAAHLSEHGTRAVDLTVVTYEHEPLGLFGSGSPAVLHELLARSGVGLITESPASHVEGGRLHFANEAAALPADHVVALPSLEVPDLPGIPQRGAGFIPTDVRMNVEGMTNVWAAGDATWFPIKQGGLAAQQADAAVAGIASHLGFPTPIVPFRPVLRGALLTGTLPLHFRTTLWGSPELDSSVDALWWPPGKLAGRYLSPYLAQRSWSIEDSPGFTDIEPIAPAQSKGAEREQREVVELALSAAEADARAGDPRGALEWLRVVEEVNLVLPPPWPQRRHEWLQALGDADPVEEARL